MTRLPLALLLTLSMSTDLPGQKPVRFPLANGTGELHADLYGIGPRAVILAHGGRFGKESWAPQAKALSNAGFRVLALAFRGDHPNPDGSPGSFGSDDDNRDDVLAAIRYLQQSGAKEIDAVGGSFGGYAVGDADAASPGALGRVIFLGSEGGSHPERLTGRKLFIVARGDRSGSGLRLPGIQENFGKAPEPKQLLLLSGSAHAQFLFATSQGPRLLSAIERFLIAK